MTATIPAETILNQLTWRYAVKQFDTNRKIDEATWAAIEEALILTPSSFGLQPWQFFVITDSSKREALVEHSWGQAQVADSSHLVVFTVPKKLERELVDSYIARIAEVRGVSLESLDGLKRMIIGAYIEGKGAENADFWMKKQCYIALGNLLTTAALMGVDACPMEGFNPAKYDELLGLGEKGLTSVVICPLGYRADSDKYAHYKKVRFAKEQVIQYI